MNHHEDRTADEDTADRRRLPLVVLAALGVSMVAGPLVTDKAPGAWGTGFTVAGAVLILAAAALWAVDAMQAHGITPTDDTDDTDDTNGSTDR